ncbi:unnamed protein product [Mytilus coruscus]|uniref:BIRC2_3 n=1 Tax=Mytilus coruscus TaxID=42192 RepID=A0A6J8F1Q1_MYTCO|nr:unnamed protein product [Mytilus coruscus]
MIDIEVSYDTSKINKSNRFKLTCSSCKEPDTKGVDISINEVLVDSIRYESGLCYHKRRLCTPKRCSCLARGNHYTWTLISNLSYIQFTCTMRFRDAMNSTILIAEAHVIYNGSVIVQKQKKNESINHSDKNPEYPNPDKDMTHNSEQDVKELPKRCDGTGTADTYLQYITDIFNVVSGKNSIDELAFFLNACKQFEEIGFKILKGLGVEVEENRVSFHMKAIQSLGEDQCRCLPAITAWLFRGRSVRFLRLYDVGKFNLNDLQLNKNMYNQLYKIFEMIIDMKSEKSWYHYRRNGLTYKGPSEGAFILVKQVFLNKKSSSIFPQFSSYKSRFASFHDYPIEIMSYRKKLAQAGFFYFHMSDYVQCYNCGGCLRDWKDMIDPLVRHIETFQTCEYAIDPERKRSSFMDEGPVKYVGQQTYENRLNSFKSFPDTLLMDDFEQLAIAGFYYCGIAQDIECCACNIEFSDIKNTAYILRQHKKSSPECPYINKCDNQAKRKDTNDQESVSCAQYLELEYRSHDFRIQNI